MTDPLILIPGFLSDAELWAPLIAALGDAARCTVGDTLRDATLPDMARRILEHAPPRFNLAGVSMGGMVALEVLHRAPERVMRLALIDTTARADSMPQKLGRRIANVVLGAGGPFERLVSRSMETLVHPSAPPELRSALAAMSVRLGPEVFIRQNRALARRRDMRALLPDIAVPTAVIAGEEDRKVSVQMSREIHALVPGSTLDVIGGCGHLPPAERPAILAGLLRQWLHVRADDGPRASCRA